MFKDVFISHAKEDYEVAEMLYDYLNDRGYAPWLDKKNLKAGENWDYAIKKALKESTFVIVLLSSISVRKRGYVQKEFKYALEYSESKLIDDIYIIPILLDDCEIPEHLNRFHWVSINSENTLAEILVSLNTQRQKYLETLSSEDRELNDYGSLSIDLNIDTPGRISYECDLPHFYKNSFFDSDFINTFIQQKALEFISTYRHWVNESTGFLPRNEDDSYYFYITHSISNLNINYLSLSIHYESYFGTSHPNNNVDTLNFAFNPDRILKFRDIFEYVELSEFLEHCLTKYGDPRQVESLEDYINHITEDDINFVINDTTLEIYFMNIVPRIILADSFLEIPIDGLVYRNSVANIFNKVII